MTNELREDVRSQETAARLEGALDRADFNALRLALYQITGDETLAAMRTEQQPVWGGVFSITALAAEHHAEVKARARDFLTGKLSGGSPSLAQPGPDDVQRLMTLFSGRPLTENEVRFGAEELALMEFPRGLSWPDGRVPERAREIHCTIVGCGISGIAIGVQLKRLGIPFVILEREASIGGTWYLNSYPDCRVDITSHLYQFKFEKNYPWSEHFASRDENLNYLRHIVEKYGLTPHIRLNTSVVGGEWDEDAQVWNITTRDGGGREETHRTNFVFNATGQFSKPKVPDFPGMDGYRGTIMHTARWDRSVDLSGKRVALVGNGATGTQLMPRIAEIAEKLVVYQRTPQWIIPFDGYKHKIGADDRLLFEKIPFYWNWYCYSAFVRTYMLQHLTVYDPEWRAKGGLVSQGNDQLRKVLIDYIREKVKGDEEKLGKLIPPFPPLARRMLVDNGWYDALERENVELATEGIGGFTPDGIRSADGTERPFDAVILASGFDVSGYMWPIEYKGRKGFTPGDVWSADGARAYLSILMPEFPNFFMFYGPNAQPRAGGHYSWAESWARYAIRLVMQVIETGASSVEVKKAAYEDYNAQLDEASKINLRGPESKGSYYVNEFGRASVNVPWLAEDWYSMLAEPDFGNFDIR